MLRSLLLQLLAVINIHLPPGTGISNGVSRLKDFLFNERVSKALSVKLGHKYHSSLEIFNIEREVNKRGKTIDIQYIYNNIIYMASNEISENIRARDGI